MREGRERTNKKESSRRNRREVLRNTAEKVHVLKCTYATATDGYWDNKTPPVLNIQSGDIVEIETGTHLRGKMKPGVKIPKWMKMYRELIRKNPDTYLYPDQRTGVEKKFWGPNHAHLTGPIFVDGARARDVLQIEILEIIPYRNGFNLNPDVSFAKAGLLFDDFPKGRINWYKLDTTKKSFTFRRGIKIPVRPFPGTIGVELPEPGKWSNIAPGMHGGNIDNKELTAGAAIYLPIWVKGAGLKIGDSHLAQGNGEVNLNGLEGAFRKIKLRLTVRGDLKALVDWPMASTATHWITMGFHTDLLESCKMATRKAIKFLNRYYGLSKEEAYAFCSMAVDLHVTQLVDLTIGIHAMIPKTYFVGKRYLKKNSLLLRT